MLEEKHEQLASSPRGPRLAERFSRKQDLKRSEISHVQRGARFADRRALRALMLLNIERSLARFGERHSRSLAETCFQLLGGQ